MRFLALSLLLLFAGCANKATEPIYIYKDVLVPTVCPLKVPKKPSFDGSFESAKEVMVYLLECENIAKICTKEANND